MIKEYYLPSQWDPAASISSAGPIPKEIKRRLDAWTSSLLGLSATQVQQRLVDRFRAVDAAFLSGLKSQLLAEKKFSVICTLNDNEQPEAVLAFSESGDAKHYLPPPPSKNVVLEKLKELRLEKVEGLEQFVSAFDGIRSMPPSLAGNFEPVSSWRCISESDFHAYLQLSKAWDSAVPIYTGTNGDQVLLHKANRLAWISVGSIGIKLRRGSFTDFVADYALDKFWDSYSDEGLAKK